VLETDRVLSGNYGETIVHRHGTFRASSPEETLKVAWRAAKLCGVSRLAGITGLDSIGVPVWSAIRPLARSLSVSQGKGLTDVLAQVSGLMEAIENFHAENLLPPSIRRSMRAVLRDSEFVAVETLPIRANRRLDFESIVDWLEAHSIVTGKTRWIPKELIDLDATQIYDGLFVSSSNGLASGNSGAEALLHALCEVLERDQISHWLVVEYLRSDGTRRRLELSGGLPVAAEQVVTMIERAGLEVAVWHSSITTDVPCFFCSIADARGNTLFPQLSTGYGCHPSKEIALLRALTEAVQSRVTFISGSRDDLFVNVYRDDIPVDRAVNRDWLTRMRSASATLSYEQIPDFEHFDNFPKAIEFVVSRMLQAGISDVVALDLTNEKIGIPVLYVCAPLAEFDLPSAAADPGLRLCSFLRTQTQHRN